MNKNYDLAVECIGAEIDALFKNNAELLKKATSEETFGIAEHYFDEAIVNVEMADALIALQRKYIWKRAWHQFVRRAEMSIANFKSKLS